MLRLSQAGKALVWAAVAWMLASRPVATWSESGTDGCCSGSRRTNLDRWPMACSGVACVVTQSQLRLSEEMLDNRPARQLEGPACLPGARMGRLNPHNLGALFGASARCGWCACRDHYSRPLCQRPSPTSAKSACCAAEDCASGSDYNHWRRP